MADEKHPELQKELSISSSDEEELETLETREIHGLSGKELVFNHDAGFPWRNMEVFRGDTPAYFCEIHEFTNNPDIIFHRGADRSGLVIGEAHYRFKFSLRIGIGTDEYSKQWIEMKRGGWAKTIRYRFEWQGKHYTMKRAKSEDYGGSGLKKLLLTHFKIVDDASEEMVALYISEPGFGKHKGTLKLRAGCDEELEKVIVLGLASCRDKIRRSRRNRSGGGGGGGGGGG